MQRNTERDRKIHEAFETGQSLEQLSKFYKLSGGRICKIVTAERHKRAVSPDPFYRAIRYQSPQYG
jgi:Mor family transcriptional regulator